MSIITRLQRLPSDLREKVVEAAMNTTYEPTLSIAEELAQVRDQFHVQADLKRLRSLFNLIQREEEQRERRQLDLIAAILRGDYDHDDGLDDGEGGAQ